MDNLYQHPEKFGFDLLMEVGVASGYSWSTVLVFLHKESGKYYWYSGGGCSCDWVGDWVTSPDDLELISPTSMEILIEDINSCYDATDEEKIKALETLRELCIFSVCTTHEDYIQSLPKERQEKIKLRAIELIDNPIENQ